MIPHVLTWPETTLAFVLYVVVGVVPVTLGIYLIYFLLTIPLRRNERARIFLDLLELGLASGRTAEQSVIGPARSRDRTLGVNFHLLAAYLEQGLSLPEALQKAPRLLPPEVQAMLRAGHRIGDTAKVIPACRMLIRDAVSHVRGATNYVVLLAFVVTPFSVIIPFMIRYKILPAYKMVFEDMLAGTMLPAFTRLVFDTNGIFGWIQIGMLLVVWVSALAYLGGPRFRAWTNRVFFGLADRLAWRMPWRRKRLHRNFSAMLSLLLDAGVPEPEAVRLAGESTANRVMIGRAEQVRKQLESGVKLPEALQTLDNSKELRWRLANAMRSTGSFARSLAGWHEALDAKAFQQEQAAAQIATTALVLLNGVVVGSVVLGMFLALISMLHRAVLW